jgi:hypothetical protein
MQAAANANRLTANTAMLLNQATTKLSEVTGIPMGGLFGDIENWARGQQASQEESAAELAGGRQDFASHLNRSIGGAAFNLPAYGAATAAGGSVAGMAGISALETADQGWQETLKAAAQGALMGGALHVMGPAGRPVRLTGAGAMTYAQLRLQGADHETALANAMTMGGLAGMGPGGGPGVRAIGRNLVESLPRGVQARIPETVRITPRLLRNQLNPIEQANQQYLESLGIQTPLSMRTGNRSAAVLEGSVRSSVGGGRAKEIRRTTEERMQQVGREQLERISPEQVSPEEAGAAVRTKIATDLETMRSGLAGEVSPQPATPESAGLRTIEQGKAEIQRFHQAANEAYEAAWQAERDPRNVETVPTGELDEAGKPVTEKMALPIDLGPVQEALRPFADQYEYTLRETDIRASLGLKAMRQIIDGPRFKPASAAEVDLGMLKEASRTEKGMAELRDPSQGLAAKSVAELQAAIDGKLAKAAYPGWDPASGAPSPAMGHLRSGRKATAQKHDVADVFKGFGRNIEELEPVGVYRRMLWEGDAGIEHLRDVARVTPDAMAEVGRAFIDGGGKWETLGPETKKILFQDEKLIRNLNEYYAKKARFGPLTALEPVALFDRLTASEGRRNELLESFARETVGRPAERRMVGRAFVEGLLDRITREGNVEKVQSTLNQWLDMDQRSKLMLVGDAKLVASWDNFFRGLKRLNQEVNTSGTGYVNAINNLKGGILKGVFTGVGGLGSGASGAGFGFAAGAAAEVGVNAVLARLLYNKRFANLLTNGIDLQLKGDRTGTRALERELTNIAKKEPPEDDGGGPPPSGGGGGIAVRPDMTPGEGRQAFDKAKGTNRKR